MYNHTPIGEKISNAKTASQCSIERYGVGIYVDCDPDIVGPDIYIDPADDKGILIFREFATKMAEHFKSLQNGSGN